MIRLIRTGFKTHFGCNRLQSSWICSFLSLMKVSCFRALRVGKKASRRASARLRGLSTSSLAHELFARFRYKSSFETSSKPLVLLGMIVALSVNVGIANEVKPYVSNEILVAMKGDNGLEKVSLRTTDRDVLAECRALRQQKDVAWAQPNYRYYPCQQPNDPDFPDQYAHQLIEMTRAWDISTGRSDMVIAVLGTGVEVEHPDLKANIWQNHGEIPNNHKDDDHNGYVDDIHGWDFDYQEPDVNPEWFLGDDAAHETMVAGVIGAVGNNDLGVTGINWQCSIMVLQVGMDFTSSQIADGLRYAADNGAKIVNMSFGSTGLAWGQDRVVQEAVDYASEHGVLLVASAGNSDIGLPGYPAAFPSVMAISSTNGEDFKTEHSCYGLWVDLAAPGTDIMTTDVGGEYIATAGTSFSSPYVAAVAGLVWSYKPDLSATEVRAILENTADPIYYGDLDPNAGYLGRGRVNAYKALLDVNEALPLGQILNPGPWETLPDMPDTFDVNVLAHGQTYELSIRPYGDSIWTMVSQGGPGANDRVTVPMETLPAGVYEICLKVTSNGHTHEDKSVFGIGQWPNQSGWPKQASSGNYIEEVYYNSPLCDDMNGDGQNEILQTTLFYGDWDYSFKINLWNADGNNLPGWPQELYTEDVPVCRVGDIDGDGDNEVVAVCYWDAEVYAWHIESGELVDGDWPQMLSWYDMISCPPVLTDLDGDGDKEILVALDGTTASSDGLYALQEDGSSLWQRRYSTSSPIAVGDLNGDGQIEIALSGYGPGMSNMYTYLLDSRGQQIKRWRGGSTKGTVIADINGDDQGEMIFCTEDSVQAVSMEGTTVWSTDFEDEIDEWGAMSVGDLDGDNRPEVFVSTLIVDDGYAYSKLYAFDYQGTLLADLGFPKLLMGYAWECEPLIADIDADGQKEVLASATGAPIIAWEADGSVTPGFPILSLANDYTCTPAIQDLDQDGDMELITLSYDYKFVVIDMNVPYQSGLVDWGMYRHDVSASGSVSKGLVWDDLDVPQEVRVGDVLRISFAGTYDDTQPVWFNVSDLPQGAVYDANALTIVWKPSVAQAFQSFKIQVSLTNGVAQMTQSFDVAVTLDALYYASMDENPNWQLDSGWAWGVPIGLGSWGGDPVAGYTGSNVIGTNLSGDYLNGMSQPAYAQTGPIDCSGRESVTLSFQRWLAIETPYDQATVEVSNDGQTWTILWQTGQAHVQDQAWQHQVYTVPDSVARDQATVYFRWSLGPTDDSVTYPGWNLDDVLVLGDSISR